MRKNNEQRQQQGVALLCLHLLLASILGLTTGCNSVEPVVISSVASSTSTDTRSVTDPISPVSPQEDAAATYIQEHLITEIYRTKGIKDISNEGSCERMARAFLDYLVEGNALYAAACLGASDPDAYSFITEAVIDRYEIIDAVFEPEAWNTAWYYKVILWVSESDGEIFPVGESYWLLGTGGNYESNVSLFISCEKDSVPQPGWWQSGGETDFCYYFSDYLNHFASCDDFDVYYADKKKDDGYLHRILHFYDYYKRKLNDQSLKDYPDSSAPGGATAVSSFISIVAGIYGVDYSNYNIGDPVKYDPVIDALPMCGHGGRWFYWRRVSEAYDSASKQYTAVLNYYTDTAQFIVGLTMQYVYRLNDDGSFTMVSTELLYDSRYGLAQGVI